MCKDEHNILDHLSLGLIRNVQFRMKTCKFLPIFAITNESEICTPNQ